MTVNISTNLLPDEKIAKKLEKHKNVMRDLCNDFLCTSKEYKTQSSINKIKNFTNNNSKLDRLLYSEINLFLFELDEEEIGTFASNLDLLMEELEKIQEEDVRKIIIKIYDHFHLIVCQSDKFKETTIKYSEELREKVIKEIKQDMKAIETNYISILGIFASIILTFVGGITFSTSVLQNIHKASIYRIVFITCILSITLIFIFYLLIIFLISINKLNFGKDLKKDYLYCAIRIILICMILDCLAWFLNLHLYQCTTRFF